MKLKIILVLAIFTIILIFSYSNMNKKSINYTILGDKELFSNNIISKNFLDLIYDELKNKTNFGLYNKSFLKEDIRIIDVINQIKDNEKINDENIQKVLKNSNILILHIGNNEIRYKLSKYDINENNERQIYIYLNQIIDDYKTLIELIKKYNNNNIIILGNYNDTNINKNNKYYKYVNDKLYNYSISNNIYFIDINSILIKDNNLTKTIPIYITNEGNLALFNKIYSKINNLYLHKIL